MAPNNKWTFFNPSKVLLFVTSFVSHTVVLRDFQCHSSVLGPLLFLLYTHYCSSYTYPEWPDRQCVGLAYRMSHDRDWFSAASPVICSPARIAVCTTWSSGGAALCRVGGATSQLDLPSLTPLSVAGCGWLQLGAPHWATSGNYWK